MGERDEKPLKGGLFRGKLARGVGTVAVGLAEEVFAPAKHEARQQQEERKQLAEPVPAPTDPPDLTPGDGSADSPYRARITLQRPQERRPGDQE